MPLLPAAIYYPGTPPLSAVQHQAGGIPLPGRDSQRSACSNPPDDFGALDGELIVGQQAIVVELVELGQNIGR
jgi:hypothetical protein